MVWVFSPTILDLAYRLDMRLSVLAVMFFVRATGMTVGTILIGCILDRLPKWTYSFMSFLLLATIASKLSYAHN